MFKKFIWKCIFISSHYLSLIKALYAKFHGVEIKRRKMEPILQEFINLVKGEIDTLLSTDEF